MNWQLKTIEEALMSGACDRAIRKLLCRCFPVDRLHFATSRAWHGSSAAFTVIAPCKGQLIGHVGVVERTIGAGQRLWRVGGIQNVCVDPAQRGRGLVEALMGRAMEQVKKRGMEAGVLFCIPALERVYQRCGWQTLRGARVTRLDEQGRALPLPGRNITMVYPLAGKLAAGNIHLRGNDW